MNSPILSFTHNWNYSVSKFGIEFRRIRFARFYSRICSKRVKNDFWMQMLLTKWRFETEFEAQRFGIGIHRNVNSEFWDIVNQFCQHSFEEIWSKSLQSDFWALTAFVKKAILRQNLNFERLKLNSNRWWWINFANIHLKKFGQNLFKVVFECSSLSRETRFWDRIWTSRDWNWLTWKRSLRDRLWTERLKLESNRWMMN